MQPVDPFVSIITPTHNRAELLSEAIGSVLSQTYQEYEMLIVDNGSTDHTREVVEGFSDERIRYLYQENSGSPVSPRNRGCRNARGEILCFLDSDDLWMPEKLATQVQEFTASESVGLVYGDCLLIDHCGAGTRLYSEYYKPYQGYVLESLLRCNFIPAVTVGIRKKLVEQYGYQDEGFRVAHDYDLYLKIANEHEVRYMNGPLAKLRMHHGGFSRNRVSNKLEVMEAIKPWCSGQRLSRLSEKQRRRIWASWCWKTGLEMLDGEGNAEAGRSLIRDAAMHDPWRLVYWLGACFARAPELIRSRTMSLARRSWSAEGEFIHERRVRTRGETVERTP